MPTYFIRTFEWSPQFTGYTYGAILAVGGGAGVLVGAHVIEWMEKRGYSDAYLRLPLISLPISSAIQITVPFIPNPYITLVVVSVFTFLGTLPLSGIMASFQVISPNQMRGQMTSLYFFIANITGLAGGPWVVAMFTDYVFRDEMAVGYSLSSTVALIAPIATVIIYFSLAPFRESFERSQAWANVTEPGHGHIDNR